LNYYGSEIKEVTKLRTHMYRWGEHGICTEFWWTNPLESDHLKDPGNGRNWSVLVLAFGFCSQRASYTTHFLIKIHY
jgi:hypothetical protein